MTVSRSWALLAVAGLLLAGVCGCNKAADTTAGAPDAGKGTPAAASTVTPEVQSQIDAAQKADAARHAAQAAGKAK